MYQTKPNIHTVPSLVLRSANFCGKNFLVRYMLVSYYHIMLVSYYHTIIHTIMLVSYYHTSIILHVSYYHASIILHTIILVSRIILSCQYHTTYYHTSIILRIWVPCTVLYCGQTTSLGALVFLHFKTKLISTIPFSLVNLSRLCYNTESVRLVISDLQLYDLKLSPSSRSPSHRDRSPTLFS